MPRDPILKEKEADGGSHQTRAICWVKRSLKGDYAEHVFYHELVHLILFHLNEWKINQNEKFVDSFAGLLHQFVKTRKP